MGKSGETGTRVGIISDTHGLLRPQAVDALRGSDLILHAGDIGKAEILEALRQVAPVVAVRGNNDSQDWAAGIAEWEVIQVEDVSIYMLHDVKDLKIDPAAAGCQLVVSGHSHKPSVKKRDDVLFVNPGSAGPGRFKLPISIACLLITGTEAIVEIVNLEV